MLKEGARGIRLTRTMERRSGSLRLDVGDLDHLGPFLGSSAMSLPKSSGDPESGVPPRSARRALSVGSARPALVSLLSLSMISAGVPVDAPRPYHCRVALDLGGSYGTIPRWMPASPE